MSAYSEYWDREVKVVAGKCVMVEVMELLRKNRQEVKVTSEDRVRFKELSSGRVDVPSMFYISDMMWAVEHSLADDRAGMGMLRVSEVHATLSDPEYWDHVWGDRDQGVEEALNLKSLCEKLGILIGLFGLP